MLKALIILIFLIILVFDSMKAQTDLDSLYLTPIKLDIKKFKRIGYTIFYHNGQRIIWEIKDSVNYFIQNSLTGSIMSIDKKGYTRKINFYKQGELRKVIYFKKKNQKWTELDILNNKLHGKLIHYYKYNRVRIVDFFEKGLISAPQITYDEQGNIKGIQYPNTEGTKYINGELYWQEKGVVHSLESFIIYQSTFYYSNEHTFFAQAYLDEQKKLEKEKEKKLANRRKR